MRLGTAYIFSWLCPIVITVCFILLFLHSKLVLHSLESLFFKNTFPSIFFYLVLYLWLVGSEGAYKILLARGTACIFSRLCPTVTTVFFTFYFFCTPNLSYTPWNHFFQEYISINFFFIWYCASSWLDLKGLIKYY